MKNRAKRVKRLMKVWAAELRIKELKAKLVRLRRTENFFLVRNGKVSRPNVERLREDIAILEEGKAVLMDEVRAGDLFDQREQN